VIEIHAVPHEAHPVATNDVVTGVEQVHSGPSLPHVDFLAATDDVALDEGFARSAKVDAEQVVDDPVVADVRPRPQDVDSGVADEHLRAGAGDGESIELDVIRSYLDDVALAQADDMRIPLTDEHHRLFDDEILAVLSWAYENGVARPCRGDRKIPTMRPDVSVIAQFSP